jgi:hypothetical protein
MGWKKGDIGERVRKGGKGKRREKGGAQQSLFGRW